MKQLKDKQVLTVDDEMGVRELIETMLMTTPWFKRVIHAKDGAEAWCKIQKQEFDLIIVDLCMPKINGLELIGMIKANMKYKNIPIVIVSAQMGKEELYKIVSMGVKDMVVKPFKRDMMINTVVKAIGPDQLL
ncbi:MAG: response regulator [Halobacteriovoraceae bacterium]|jgi:CheY-like chemotaxis protein|nr:response regulator [Halobacteriovoraceae bacterium]MBT5094985.1 response regulator [Halobacteriovoraceae bacterium]